MHPEPNAGTLMRCPLLVRRIPDWKYLKRPGNYRLGGIPRQQNGLLIMSRPRKAGRIPGRRLRILKPGFRLSPLPASQLI
jgi:hypothetical protein